VQQNQTGGVRTAQRAAQRVAREIDRVGVDIPSDFARDVGFAGQMQRQSGERRVDASLERVGDDRAVGGDEAAVERRRDALANRRH
jgi:hypothetical protein